MLTENLIILVCCYNHEQYISKCLDSILNQNTQYPIKIICFDDFSNDNTLKILKNYEKKYEKRIIVFENENKVNSGSARNCIINNIGKFKPNSKYWSIIDGDDWWVDKNKVNEQIKILENNDNYIGCAGMTKVINENGDQIDLIKQSAKTANLKDYIFKKQLYAHPSSIIWKNIYYESEHFFLPVDKWKKVHGDAARNYIMLNYNKNKKIYFINKVLSTYNFNGKGIWSKLSNADRKKFNQKIYLNYIKAVSVDYKVLIFLKYLIIFFLRKIKVIL
jgi:glycosyltransferase involved in cell wall biosynthesis